MKKDKIDFIVTWVDGSDEKWIKDRIKYDPSINKEDIRFRDWENLKYWFRSVEKNAPWVNNIYFVTYGHLPKWLNSKNPKLKIVNHEDFIDKKYLPLFNSCAIESNFSNIKGLSEKFIYFNDDMFLNSEVKESDFFVDNLPVDNKVIKPLWRTGKNSTYINYNCAKIVSDKFGKEKCKYSLKDIIKYVLRLPKKPVNAYIPDHVPTSFLKQTFIDINNEYSDLINDVRSHRFRTNDDVSQWLYQFWQIGSGKYVERDEKISKYYEISSSTIDEMISEILKKEYKLVCLNDGDVTTDFEENKKKIIDMFEEMYPEKSSYEL